MITRNKIKRGIKMTDKEWKELIKFVKSLKSEKIKYCNYGSFNVFTDCMRFTGLGYDDGELRFYQSGNIYTEENLLVENLTQKQIKAIIENLL
jgi:hypothetical protein